MQAVGQLMLDIEGTALSLADEALLRQPEVGGVILFGRNVESPEQVRELTDSMRAIKPNILIAVDQEGGRVARLRAGFSPLPAMGKLGERFEHDPITALDLAYCAGYLMASEVLAVGIDFSFAPVLDINGVSRVIGDRAFHAHPIAITANMICSRLFATSLYLMHSCPLMWYLAQLITNLQGFHRFGYNRLFVAN